MGEILPDFKPGPLDFYRKQASFDWKKLKVFLETEEMIHYQNEIITELLKYPEYQKNLLTDSLDEQRRIMTKRAFIQSCLPVLSVENQLSNLKKPSIAVATLMHLSPDSNLKHTVSWHFFLNCLRTMGTKRHSKFVADCEENKIYGCFCLTEIGHGTDTKGMRTTATYHKETRQFIMHSPDFEAAKCWAGGLGQAASHAVVYAKMVVEGMERGLFAFIVPIRDPKTLLPFPGIVVGDLGEKIGLNGIDNGFLMFQNYPIPRENLLNRTGDVSEDGKYVSSFKDESKRHGASLGGLAVGRVMITHICYAFGIQALTIAIRYAGVRRQFGPDGQDEVPILEYQTHHHRLLPYLAAAYAMKVFSSNFIEVFYKFSLDKLFGENKEILPEMGMEIHAISSSCKPLTGWVMRDAIQESREACGGHGYLKVAGIGEIRNNHDANLTYEGENHVLIQQTTNWLLKFWPMIEKNETISTPLNSADFLTNAKSILKFRFSLNSLEEMRDAKNIMHIFEWIVCYLLKETNDKLERTIPKESVFWAKNNSQVFYAKNLGVAFIEHRILQVFLDFISQATDVNIRNVLLRLFSLYGLWSMEKHLATIYRGEFATGPKITDLIQESILQLYTELKNDAVSLIDALAPPDLILNSVLGASDGMVYQRLQSAILQSPHAMSRPSWWNDIVNSKSYTSQPHSKL